MKTIEESVVKALDGNQPEIFQYLPYILQDFWELGSDPNTIIQLVKKHTDARPGLQVLDLACGKGAVSIKLAEATGCNCLGIDALEPFICAAAQKAAEHHVSYLCRFETSDIRTRIHSLHGFDVIILGSIGPVFGDMLQTLNAIKSALNHSGIIIIADGYNADESSFSHPTLMKKTEVLKQISQAGMQLVDETIYETDQETEALHRKEFTQLEKRCHELMQQHPDKQSLFAEYIENQRKEYEFIENDLICSAKVIKFI